MVDYDELASRTLGKPCPPAVPSCSNHWDKDLTAEQRTEVTGLLRQLVEKNYRKNLNKGFYDIGGVLKDIHARKLYEAKGYGSFEAFLERYRAALVARLEDARPFFYPFKRILVWGRRDG